MWAIDNQTAYATGRTWWRDSSGAHHWLVGAKASFARDAKGGLRLADEQVEPRLDREYFGAPGASSLRFEVDLLHSKPGTDVLVEGSAHAPRGRPTPTVRVGLRIHHMQRKLIDVHGPRVYYRGLVGRMATTSPRPFTVRDVRYEGAFGGTDTTDADARKHVVDLRNPVGKGYARSGAALENQEAHWVEYPGQKPSGPGPAGLGPVDRHWLPRAPLAGTYDQRWATSQKPLLPTDYDPRFALCAPADQQTPSPLVGGEKIELTNLTPDGAWTVELPRLALRFSTAFGRRVVEHAGQLASVLIDCNRGAVDMVWISSLAVSARIADYLDQTTVQEVSC